MQFDPACTKLCAKAGSIFRCFDKQQRFSQVQVYSLVATGKAIAPRMGVDKCQQCA